MHCLFESFSSLLTITKVICLKVTNVSSLHQGLLGMLGMEVSVGCLLVVLQRQLLHTALTIFPMAIMDMEDMVTCLIMGNSSMASSSMENSASMGSLSMGSLASMVCSGSGSNHIYQCIYNHDSKRHCCC
jgi:hypothetical protein